MTVASEVLRFVKTPKQILIPEEYELRVKSSIPKKGNIEVFKNPTTRDHKALGKVIRFTAYQKTRTVYAWIADAAHHADVSKAVGIKHRFNDPNLLTGVAVWQDGRYIFSSSDFLKDFKHMVGSEGDFIRTLLAKDWKWVDKYVFIADTIEILRKYIEKHG